jgi:hypothetical protein
MNAIYTRHFGAQLDFDMFQSLGHSASLQALARSKCVSVHFSSANRITGFSGGPITISDHPGEHDTILIDQMIGISPAGEPMVLDLDEPARPLDVYHGINDHKLFQLFYKFGHGVLLSVMNLSPVKLCESLSQAGQLVVDRAETSFVGLSYKTKNFFTVDTTKTPSIINVPLVELDEGDWDIFTIVPCLQLVSPGGIVRIAVLGLDSKFTGLSGVTGVKTVKETKGEYLEITLKALGNLGKFFLAHFISKPSSFNRILH